MIDMTGVRSWINSHRILGFLAVTYLFISSVQAAITAIDPGGRRSRKALSVGIDWVVWMCRVKRWRCS